MRRTNWTTSPVELQGVSKRFTKEIDLAARLAQKLGVDIKEEVVQAVDCVDLKFAQGEAVGLAGESGCGKSTLGRIVAGILEPSAGKVLYNGRNLASMDASEARREALKVQMIFQDPYASLNPRMRVAKIIGEAPRFHGLIKASNLNNYLNELMLRCGLDPVDKWRYPHQFSGGQRQRIAIARVLAVKPDFIVCDEIVSALDVSIQAQILNLFRDLQRDLGLTSLFISHDLGVVEHVSDRVLIMYVGRIVEEAQTEELFAAPQHPYTQALLEEVPSFDKRRIDFMPIKGEIPSPFDPPSGCHFHPRCVHRKDICEQQQPSVVSLGSGHTVSCHLFG